MLLVENTKLLIQNIIRRCNARNDVKNIDVHLRQSFGKWIRREILALVNPLTTRALCGAEL